MSRGRIGARRERRKIPETVKIEYAARMATLGGVAERAAWVPDIAPRQRPQPHHL